MHVKSVPNSLKKSVHAGCILSASALSCSEYFYNACQKSKDEPAADDYPSAVRSAFPSVAV